MRRLRLGIILTALVLVTSAPLAGLAAWLTRTSKAQQQALIDGQNVEKVRAVAEAIDLEVQRTTGGLIALTTLDPIDAADLSHFTQIAARMLAVHPTWHGVRLIDPALHVVASTEPGGGMVVSPQWVQNIFQSSRPGVSTLRQDPTGEWVVNVGVPVVRDGKVRYVVAARLRARALAEFLQRQQPPESGVLSLLDSEQTIIARTRSHERFVGSRPTNDFIERTRLAASGSWRTRMLEGTPAYSAWFRSSLTGWTVGLGLPSEPIDAPLRRRTMALVSTFAVTLGIGLIIALFIGRSIVRAQVAAGASARALARGEPVPEFHSYIAEADDLGAALREAALILDQRIRERDAAAAALNRAKDDLVATVSHELRTPLNAIYGWVAMLRTGTLDAKRQAHALEIIERNAQAQLRLVEDLLDMSAIVHGRLRLARQPVELAGVVHTAVDLIRPTSGANGKAIRVRTDGAPLVIEGDPARLQQIVWNLLANAMKFSGDDGQIDVEAWREGEMAVVRVKDDGAGISADFLPHVFERFRQESEEVTREHAGLGLGLALARTLTELHDGAITAESDGKGTGATFIVRLPLARGGHESAAPSSPDRP